MSNGTIYIDGKLWRQDEPKAIPDDIHKIAGKLFNMSWRMSHSGKEQKACINAIALALLAERKRKDIEIAKLKDENKKLKQDCLCLCLR